jgi:hypothetical protein
MTRAISVVEPWPEAADISTRGRFTGRFITYFHPG